MVPASIALVGGVEQADAALGENIRTLANDSPCRRKRADRVAVTLDRLVVKPDLLELIQRDETTSAVRTLRQHDDGLTVESFEFSDDSAKLTGRELVGHDVVPPYAVK